MHNGFLNMGEEKMSKSLGNVTLAHDLLKTVPGEAIRWALLSGHYRAPLEWTTSLLEQSKKSLDRLYQVLQDVEVAHPDGRGLPSVADGAVRENLDVLGFWDAVEDDLNTPKALSLLFRLADAIRSALAFKMADRVGIALDRASLLEAGNFLGFLIADPQAWFQGGADEDLKAKIDALVAARDTARREKDWAEADRLRGELSALNVEVMDGPAGATWRIREQA
jgi:cysteinyl-tRNA synthetase